MVEFLPTDVAGVDAPLPMQPQVTPQHPDTQTNMKSIRVADYLDTN